MLFTIRPYRRFSLQCAVTYNGGPVLKQPWVNCLGFGSCRREET
jgi:hypothetical protein